MAKSRIKKNTRIRQRERVKRKKKEKAKKVLKGLGKLSLVFLMVAGVAIVGKEAEDFLLTSPHFRLSEVNFEGLDSLEEKTLEGLAKIKLGKNIFQVDLEGMRRRLQSHPQIREVIVSRQFPRRVEVKVKEREAVALVQDEDQIYPLDKEGFILPEGSLSRPLPLIKGLGRKGMKVGERLEGTKLVIALEILEIFSSFSLPISGIDLEEPGLLVRIEEVKVFLGKERGRERQVKELKSILNDLKERQEKAEYIDLRFHNPVVKLRQENINLR